MPEDFDEHWKLEDINDMRSGYFHSSPGGRSPEQADAVKEASRLIHDKYNEKTGRAPWATYLKAANILEKVGL